METGLLEVERMETAADSQRPINVKGHTAHLGLRAVDELEEFYKERPA